MRTPLEKRIIELKNISTTDFDLQTIALIEKLIAELKFISNEECSEGHEIRAEEVLASLDPEKL